MCDTTPQLGQPGCSITVIISGSSSTHAFLKLHGFKTVRIRDIRDEGSPCRAGYGIYRQDGLGLGFG